MEDWLETGVVKEQASRGAKGALLLRKLWQADFLDTLSWIHDGIDCAIRVERTESIRLHFAGDSSEGLGAANRLQMEIKGLHLCKPARPIAQTSRMSGVRPLRSLVHQRVNGRSRRP